MLVYIAKNGGLNEFKSSTTNIAKDMQLSQQSVSRILMQMDDEGLIQRDASPKGMSIKITAKGISILKDEYQTLKSIFDNKKQDRFEGIVTSGLGEGKAYIKLEGYNDQFREKLKINPYAGTLNVKVEPSTFHYVKNFGEKINIVGFKTKDRTFGGADAYKVKINNKISGAIIIPDRTAHSNDVIEIISKDYLRNKLRLKDGDIVKLELGEMS